MCEPTHSICQFPDQDDNGNPTGGLIDAAISSGGKDTMTQSTRAGQVWEWTKKRFGNWFHFSKMGFGHSESVGALPMAGRMLLPDDTKYEAQWWDRTVKLDGWFHGKDYDKQFALECASQYAHKVSIGSLTLLRQFLETSMRRSERPRAYLEAFVQILNTKGRSVLASKLKCLGLTPQMLPISFYGRCNQLLNNQVDLAIKVMLGLTRKRRLLVPEWVDDRSLWG